MVYNKSIGRSLSTGKNIMESNAITSPIQTLWCVFVLGAAQLVICDDDLSFDLQQDLESIGWTLIWDSARSKFQGSEYAYRHYGATHIMNHIPNVKQIKSDTKTMEALSD